MLLLNMKLLKVPNINTLSVRHNAAVIQAPTSATCHPEPKIHPAQTLLIADGPYRDALDVIEFKTVGVSIVNELDEAKCVSESPVLPPMLLLPLYARCCQTLVFAPRNNATSSAQDLHGSPAMEAFRTAESGHI